MAGVECSGAVVSVTEANQKGGGGHGKKPPPKRYFTGLTPQARKERLKEIEKFGAMHWKDPRAYVGFRTDKGVRTRLSRYTRKWRTAVRNQPSQMQQKATITGIPLPLLRTSYRRGMAAWRTGHRPGATPQQWGHARVNSFLTCGKTTRTTDADLRRAAERRSRKAKAWFRKVCAQNRTTERK